MNRRPLYLVVLVATIGLVARSSVAAPSSINDPLLDHLIGTWFLRGNIAGKPDETAAVTPQHLRIRR
jgi:hypothetical protein